MHWSTTVLRETTAEVVEGCWTLWPGGAWAKVRPTFASWSNTDQLCTGRVIQLPGDSLLCQIAALLGRLAILLQGHG